MIWRAFWTVRDKRDADRLMEEMQPGRRLLVIGGGLHRGWRAAAVARQLGLEVTLIEMADRILQRVCLSRNCDHHARHSHRKRRFPFARKRALVRLDGKDGRVTKAELSDGSTLNVDFVIAGIGVTPNDRLARESGLQVGNGIVVDEFTRTSDPDIHAMGGLHASTDGGCFPFASNRCRTRSIRRKAAALLLAGEEKTLPTEAMVSGPISMT